MTDMTDNFTDPKLARPDSWRDKRVIITGGAGFLGQHLVERLTQRGAEVVVPRSKEYDLRDVGAIRQLLRDSSISHGQGQSTPVDVVIHLAAVGGIGANREHPAEFFYDNLMMGVQLIHESWRAGVSKFVAIGTVCAYPKYTPVPFREEDLWNGYPEETNAPYGLAKKMLLVQSQAYRQQYGFNSIFLLPVNLYGPGQLRPRVQPRDPRPHQEVPGGEEQGMTYRRVGGRQPTREFLYVEDAAEGIVLAAERYDGAEPVNLGSAYEISIRELVQIARATGSRGG